MKRIYINVFIYFGWLSLIVASGYFSFSLYEMFSRGEIAAFAYSISLICFLLLFDGLMVIKERISSKCIIPAVLFILLLMFSFLISEIYFSSTYTNAVFVITMVITLLVSVILVLFKTKYLNLILAQQRKNMGYLKEKRNSMKNLIQHMPNEYKVFFNNYLIQVVSICGTDGLCLQPVLFESLMEIYKFNIKPLEMTEKHLRSETFIDEVIGKIFSKFKPNEKPAVSGDLVKIAKEILGSIRDDIKESDTFDLLNANLSKNWSLDNAKKVFKYVYVQDALPVK